MLSLCRQYPNDCTEHLIYGKALALFRIGEMTNSAKTLHQAIEFYPLIVKKLLKNKGGRGAIVLEQHITLGSKEQAYLYWESDGACWAQTSGAIRFLMGRLPAT